MSARPTQSWSYHLTIGFLAALAFGSFMAADNSAVDQAT